MTVRVMIVDDSAFFRRRITEILNADAHIEVIGTANNGREAVEKVFQYEPDVITMDVEMPVMDGITAVRAIMAEHPTPILMFSSLTTDGAKATLDALDAGAMDFLPKRMEDISINRDEAKRQLCARIRALGVRKQKIPASGKGDLGRHVGNIISDKTSTPDVKIVHTSAKLQFRCKDYKVILIGASTGGPIAIQQILTRLPAGFPVPILIIQHMPASFTPTFAQRLDRISNVTVKLAEDGDILCPATVLLAPGDRQLSLDKKYGKVFVRVHEAKLEDTYKPSVDVTLSSAAHQNLEKVLVIILTGMGTDGRDGTRLLKDKGSSVWAQDESTCVVFGMPMAVIDSGLVDHVMPLAEIGKMLAQGL